MFTTRRIGHALLLVLIVLLPLGLAGAQDGGELTAALDADNAVIWHGEEGAWDGQYTDPGAVVFHDGQFHMFRNGFVGWPAWAATAYHTSADGVIWTAHGADPVLSTDDVPYADTGALVSSALVEADGTWVLYFYTWGNQFGSGPESWSIGRATAADPAGPWSVSDPLLLPGEAGTWDEAQVSAPSVVRTEAGYVMYYTGFDASGLRQIGRATSSDGVAWTKDAAPVLAPGEEGAWDAAFVHHPQVVRTPDGWVMAYRSASAGGSNKGYGLATSADGMTWARYADNPILFDKDILRRGIWFSELVYHDDTYYFFVELQRNYQNQTDIYLMTITGDLFG